MPGPRALSKAGSPERLFNLLYNTGYRLTGNHRDAAELVKCAVNLYSGDGNGGPTAAIRCLCSVFMENHMKLKDGHFPGGNHGMIESDSGTVKIQGALLLLPPLERLMVVLRDILGLDYIEIAGVTGLEKTDVARSLAAARWSLRERLVLSSPVCDDHDLKE